MLCNLASICLLANVVFLTASVLLRMAHKPISGATDIVGCISAITIAFSIPYTEMRGSHIRVELLDSYLPAKFKSLFQAVIGLLNCVIVGILAWRFFTYTKLTYELGTKWWVIQLAYWPVVLICSVGLLLYFLTAVFRTIEMFRGPDGQAKEVENE